MRQPEKGADGVYDFDALVHEPRMVRVGKELADVSMIPVAVTLALAEYSDRTREEIVAAAEEDAKGELRRVLGMVSTVCMVSNPKFTVEFLMKHLTFEKVRVFNKFVLAPVEDVGEDEKENATTTE
jgi:hypothetical protein